MSNNPDVALNPWHPISDPVTLKHFGKLAEEVNELGSIIARCIIQGVNEANPETGQINKFALENELADVLAGYQLITEHLNLDRERMVNRANYKAKRLREWHRMA